MTIISIFFINNYEFFQCSSKKELKHKFHEEFEETPTWAAVVTILGYAVLSVLGWLRDFLRHIGLEEKKNAQDPNPKVYIYIYICSFQTKERSISFVLIQDFVPLYQSYECFYTRNLYTRIRDVFNQPIASVAGATVQVMERISGDYNWTFK